MKEIRLNQLCKGYQSDNWDVYLYKNSKESFSNQKAANAFLVKISKELTECLRSMNSSYQTILSESQWIIFNLEFEDHSQYNLLKSRIDERTFFILRRYAQHNNSFYFSTLLLIAHLIKDLMQVVEHFGSKMSINPFSFSFNNQRLIIDSCINRISITGNISQTNFHFALYEENQPMSAHA